MVERVTSIMEAPLTLASALVSVKLSVGADWLLESMRTLGIKVSFLNTSAVKLRLRLPLLRSRITLCNLGGSRSASLILVVMLVCT